MSKKDVLKEKKKLETQKEKLQQSIDSMQQELTGVVESLKKANDILAKYEKADTEAAIFFGRVNENKIDG